MSPAWKGRPLAQLATCAFITIASLAAGCGAGGIAGSIGTETSPGAYAELLTYRYDEVFPDDHVLTVRVLMDDSDLEAMRADVTAKEYYRADIWIDDELVQDVAIRTKGSSSLSRAASSETFRAGLKVDFNLFNSARTYHGIKKLCYSNGFSDPTLMKEFLGYELMAAMGIPTPRACFVDLWVNDTHLGVYTQVEAVDARFVDDNFADGNGNLYKPEIAAGKLDWTEADAVAQAAKADTSTTGAAWMTTTTTQSFNLGGGNLEEIIERLGDDVGWIPGRLESQEDGETTTTTKGWAGGIVPGRDIGGFMNYSSDYLSSVGLKTNEDKADYSRLYDLLEVINSDPDEVSAEDLEDVLNVDEVLRYLAVSTSLVHLDNYTGMGHNYYLYEDGGRFSIIPWDLNMSFGGFDSGLGEDELISFFIDEPTSASVDQYPLVQQLISEPEYMETYHAYLEELVEGPFSVERMTSRINEIADLIRPYVEDDANVSLEQFEQGLTEDLASDGRTWNMGGTFIGLTYFVEARVASITAQLNGEQAASNGDGSGNGGSSGLGGMGGPQVGGGWPGAQQGGRWNAPTTTTTVADASGKGKDGGG
jgi:spore coat protein CotH